MSQNKRYRPTKGRVSSVRWFGFIISNKSAAGPLLFFGSILLIIGSVIGLIFVTIGIIQTLSMMSAMQQYSNESGTAESQAYMATYSSTAIMIYVVWIIVLLILLCIGIYTFNKMKQLRG